MKLILSCGHEITRGGLVEGVDDDGYRIFHVLGQVVIPLADLRKVRCETCGADQETLAIA